MRHSNFTVGAQSRCAIVASACAQRGMVKVINLLACRGHKGQMKRSGFIIRLKKAKRNIAGTHFDAIVRRAFIDEFDTERLKRHEEEGFTFFIIADAEFYMIKHYGLLKSDGEMRSIEREWSPTRSRGCECDRYQYSLHSRPFTPYECPTQIIIEPVKKHRVWQEKQYKANLNKKCLRDR